jgi:hypothetical protein
MQPAVTREADDHYRLSDAGNPTMVVKPRATVLITGIGCVGKSTLRRRVATELGDRVVDVDRDDTDEDPPVGPDQVLVVESVHGLEDPADRWDMVVYLLPPPGHTFRWLNRGLVWFRTGRVDRPPRAIRRPWSVLNLPLIIRIIARNIWNARRWILEDLQLLDELNARVSIVSGTNDGLHAIANLLTDRRQRD